MSDKYNTIAKEAYNSGICGGFRHCEDKLCDNTDPSCQECIDDAFQAMAELETTDVYYWPDNTWCHKDELSEYSFMSDDYAVLHVPGGIDDDIIEQTIININSRR